MWQFTSFTKLGRHEELFQARVMHHFPLYAFKNAAVKRALWSLQKSTSPKIEPTDDPRSPKLKPTDDPRSPKLEPTDDPQSPKHEPTDEPTTLRAATC